MPNNRESEMLVTTQWLATHLDDPGVCVVDTRKGDGYETSHIDGAVRYPASMAPVSQRKRPGAERGQIRRPHVGDRGGR